MQSFLINTIHDSAIGEIHPDEEELYKALCQQAMVEDVYDYMERCYDFKFNVPLEIEVTLENNWNDSIEWRERWLK